MSASYTRVPPVQRDRLPVQARDDRRLLERRSSSTGYTLPPYESLHEWETRATALRRRILVTAGLWPEPERTPLRPRLWDRLERDGYTIEKVAFESLPGFYVTGNLYRPVGVAAGTRVPGVLNPHGHFREGRLVHSERGNHARRAANLALQGYVAFLYDMVGYNDSRQVGHGTFDTYQGWLWNSHVLGLQLWNSIRALDFLSALPDVDPERLACTGESGGGTQTFLLTAVDSRVQVAAPVNMISAHMQGGCVCENAPGLRLDTFNVEIGALMAPRPLLLVSATGDWTANTPTVEYPAIRRVYALYGRTDRVETVQIDAPHNYNQASREAVYAFLARHLAGRPEVEAVAEVSTPDEPDEGVRVFPDDAPLPSGVLDETGVRTALVRQATTQIVAAWPRSAADVECLREGIGRTYVEMLALRAPSVDDLRIQRAGAHVAGDVRYERLTIGTQQHGEQIPALLLTPLLTSHRAGTGEDAGRPVRPVLLAHPAGTRGSFDEDGTRRPGPLLHALLTAGRPVLLFDAFLTGEYLTPWSVTGRAASTRHFLCFHRSDAAWRVQDVATAAAALRCLSGAEAMDIVGTEEAGLWCLLARPALPGVRRLAVDGAAFRWDDDADYLARLYLPGLRRAGDYRAAIALGAPGALLWHHTAGQVAAQDVAALYRTLGAADDVRIEARPLPPAAVVEWLNAG